MLKRIGRAFNKQKTKLRIDINFSRIEDLPPNITSCRVIWARDSKIQMTRTVVPVNGHATWNEELSIISTLTQTPKGKYEPKVYEFKVQVTDGASSSFLTLGKLSVDLSLYPDAHQQPLVLDYPLKRGTARLVLSITSTPVAGVFAENDAASVATGGSEGLSESKSEDDNLSTVLEQDLSEFDIPLHEHSSEHNQSTGEGEVSGDGTPHSVVAPLSPSSPGLGEVGRVGSAGRPPLAPSSTSVLRSESSVSRIDSEAERLRQQLAAMKSGSGSVTPRTPHKNMHVLEEENEYLAGKVEQLEEALEAMRASRATAAAAAEGDTIAASSAREQELEIEIQHLTHEIEELQAFQDGAAIEELHLELEDAQAAAAEAEAVAEEAVAMLEAAQAERQKYEAEAAQLRKDLEYKEKKATKDRHDWEARINDSFKKMEATVLLAERVQREKTEIGARLAMVQAEKVKLEELVVPSGVEKRIAVAVEKAKAEERTQADIDRQGLLKRIKEMEEFVEQADARALQAAAKSAQLEAGLSRKHIGGGGGGDDEDWMAQVRAAEERADALSLELQYVQAEKRQLQQRLQGASLDKQNSASVERLQREEVSERLAELESQLENSQDKFATAENNVKRLRQQLSQVEAELDNSKLEMAHMAASSASLSEASVGGEVDSYGHSNSGNNDRSSAAGGGGVVSSPAIALQAQSTLRRIQQDSNARNARLESLESELSEVTGTLRKVERERDAVRADATELKRQLRLSDNAVQRLTLQLNQTQAQVGELEKAQKELIAAATSSLGGGGAGAALLATTIGSGGGASGRGGNNNTTTTSAKGGGSNSNNVSGTGLSAAEIITLQRQLKESQQLTEFATAKTADLILQLAESQADKADMQLSVSELREESSRLRAGPDGELRSKIEHLERELQVAKNRADVNVLLREEQQRIAHDLIMAKVGLAEAQELIVKLKRALMKSQERSMAYASRLTKMETKLYRRVANVVTRKKGGSSGALNREGSGGSLASMPSSTNLGEEMEIDDDGNVIIYDSNTGGIMGRQGSGGIGGNQQQQQRPGSGASAASLSRPGSASSTRRKFPSLRRRNSKKREALQAAAAAEAAANIPLYPQTAATPEMGSSYVYRGTNTSAHTTPVSSPTQQQRQQQQHMAAIRTGARTTTTGGDATEYITPFSTRGGEGGSGAAPPTAGSVNAGGSSNRPMSTSPLAQGFGKK